MSNTDAVIERAAIRAPSVHNTQPWRFVVASLFVELHLDRDRVLPVADPVAREARMPCGAALVHPRLAIEAAGRGVVVDLLPDAARPDLLDVRGYPRTVLHIGYGHPVGRTPRRPVSAVTTVRTEVRS